MHNLSTNWWEYGPVLNQEDEGLNTQDILAELETDVEEPTDDEVVVPDPEPEEKEEDDKEDEVIEPGEDDEKEEKSEQEESDDSEFADIITPLNRKALLKDFPTIFKKYPQLEKGYYGNQEYRKVFPTLDDAREAQDKVEVLDQYTQELHSGQADALFRGLKSQNEEAFAKLVDNYLPTLAKVDGDAYHHVLGNVIKATIFDMMKVSQENQDSDLGIAAKMLKEHIFGKADITPRSSFQKAGNPEQDKIRKEREDLEKTKLSDKQSDVSSSFESSLKEAITEVLDPKGAMTAYVKKTATKDALDMVKKTIAKDKEFQRVIAKQWERAAKDGYPREAVSKIRSNYLSKSKAVLPQVIRKIRSEALPGLGRGDGKRSEGDRKGPLPTQGMRSVTPARGKDGKIKIPEGMSDIDFLNS
jgi:hypothetical protein